MGINLSGRKLRVLIGSDSQDWSPCAGRFVPGRESLGQDGTLANTATLNILKNHFNPESIDPDVNPARWRPGQLVKVQVTNSSGAFVDHPLGHLYVLTEPAYDDEAEILPLDLGDWLAWGDTTEPADDVSAIILGTAEDTSVIAQRYLEAADIPAASINLGGPWGYSVALPVTKPSGSYVQKAGELAYASDFRVLYQDKAGIVRAHQATTTAKATPDLTLDLNTENLRFDRLSDPQEPFEVIRVVGVGETLSQPLNPRTQTIPADGSETFIYEAFDLDPDVRVGPNGSITPLNSGEFVSRTNRLRFRQAKSQVVEGSTDDTFIVVDDTWEIRYYENINNGPPYRLHSIFKYTEKARSAFDSSSPNADTTRRVQELGVRHNYDADGRPSSITEEEFAIELIHDPQGSDVTRREVRNLETLWIKEGDGLYAYRSSQKDARITFDKNAGLSGGNKWQFVQNKQPDIRPALAKGQNEPPPVDEWEGPYLINSSTYEGEVTWQHRGGPTGRNRTRPPFQLPQGLGFSNAQCIAIATIHRDLLAGRKRGQLIQIALSDALLALDVPLIQIAVTCLDGWVRTYLLDTQAFEHQRDRVFCEGAGILIQEVAP